MADRDTIGASTNGTPHAEGNGAPAAIDSERRWNRLRSAFSALGISAEQLRQLPQTPGADDEAWDVLLSTTATDEHTALEALAKRFGIPFEPDPRPGESAERFFEKVPAAAARRHQVAGLRFDGQTMVITTSQPLQPAVFEMLERVLEMPV